MPRGRSGKAKKPEGRKQHHSVPQSAHNVNKLILERGGARDVLISPEHDTDIAAQYQPVTVSITDGLTVAWNGTEHDLKRKMDDNNMHSIVDMIIEWEITCGGVAGTDWNDLLPANHFAKWIRFERGGGQPVQRRSSMANWIFMGTVSNEQREDLGMHGNFTNQWAPSHNRGDGSRILAGDTRIYTAHYKYLFTETFGGFPARKLDSELELTITMAKQAYAARSGAAATLTLNAVRVTFRQSRDTSPARNASFGLYANNQVMANYLEEIDNSKTAQTINAGVETRITLDTFKNHRIAFMTVAVREAQDTATNWSLIRNLPLGKGALLDVIDSTGTSIMGSRQRVEVMDSVLVQDFLPSHLTQAANVYVITWAKDVKAALMGVMDGYRDWNEATDQLSITPSSTAATVEVQTVTPTGTAASGYYRLSFLGEVTDPLAFNTTAANMQVAFDALESVRTYPGGLYVTISGPATAAFTITFSRAATFALPSARTFPMVQLISESLETVVPAAVSATTTRTTVGNDGWTNGSYYVDIRGFGFLRADYDRGVLSIQELFQGNAL